MRYDKGRKDVTRQRILEVAADRFRSDGIAASGLAGIMSDAGLTNGAFYPHFSSKADLVRESVAEAMDGQANSMREIIAAGGIDAAITEYLSPEHRDNPAKGCTLAALLPELARQPLEARSGFSERFLAMTNELAAALPSHIENREEAAMSIYATLVGTLQLARTVEGADLSDRVLAAGTNAARALANVQRGSDA